MVVVTPKTHTADFFGDLFRAENPENG